MTKFTAKCINKQAKKKAKKSGPKRMDFEERYKRYIRLEHHFTPDHAARAQAMLARGDFVSEVAEYFRVKVETIEALDPVAKSDPRLRRLLVIPKAPKRLSPKAVETMETSLRSLQAELDTLKKTLEEAAEA